jgi:thiamine-phosphate pyrophosphorylase
LIRYYITDRRSSALPLVDAIRRAVRNGVEYVQIREKDLHTRELLVLARKAVELTAGTRTRVLINDRADIALASGAHGVHLPSHSIKPSKVRSLGIATVAVSCHSLAEVRAAEQEGADFVVFGPVFYTVSKEAQGEPLGLDALHQAARSVRIPVCALGGVTRRTARSCLDAGAAGVAGISMFQSIADQLSL